MGVQSALHYVVKADQCWFCNPCYNVFSFCHPKDLLRLSNIVVLPPNDSQLILLYIQVSITLSFMPPPCYLRTKKEKIYYRYLVCFMTFKDNTDYDKDSNIVEFTQEQLLAITPDDLKRWMCVTAYGVADPGPDDRPTHARSVSLENAKKAISFFMPRKQPWDDPSMVGNPTRSIAVNGLIRSIRRHEVRGEGVPSSAKRAVTKAEFEQAMNQLNSFDDIHRKYMIPAACKFQFAMIGRVDDVCHFKEVDLNVNPLLPSSLVARIRWSKNVMEERNSPRQMIFGSMDTRYCVLLSLGIYYLEVWCEAGDGLGSPYLFGCSDDPDRNKAFIANKLKRHIWDATNDAGNSMLEASNLLGTHSLRKFSTSYAMRNGCPKDYVAARGRWRKKQVVDRYIDIELPYPDAKVASVLAVGGPMKYVVKNGSGVLDNWLLTQVVPHLSRSVTLSQQVALVLAPPVLWAAFEESMELYMPVNLRNRIQAAYNALENRLPVGQNPVQRIPIIVTGHDDQVFITEVFPEEDVDRLNGRVRNLAANIGGGGGRDDLLRAVHAQVGIQRREGHARGEALIGRLDRLSEYVSQMDQRHTQQMNTLRRSVHRVALQPVQRPRVDEDGGFDGGQQDAGEANARENATLIKNPRSLHLLWQEYEFGIGGRKPAKNFNAIERGRVKYAYYRRKIAWEMIAGLVRGGHTAQVAIDMIYEIYGASTGVTTILRTMRHDMAAGRVHPSLRV
ncbi:hypothetical protein MHU86_4567 [Fragilaria crotonensis]|nr:hypothetical protein MHU86_4567 [Fragilaria crotonensis]